MARYTAKSLELDLAYLNNRLFEEVEVCAGNEVDPPEYQRYRKLCHAPIEWEHEPNCLFYPLMMAR